MTRSLLAKSVLCIVLLEAIGSIGGLITSGSVDGWYETLRSPAGTPPNWIFAPVWTLLYALIGTSFATIWHQTEKGRERNRCIKAFAIQLFLNLAWTPIFFGAHMLDAALIVIILLLLSIATMTFQFGRTSKVAAWLLVPYFVWVMYATYLNIGYLILNR